MATENPAPDKHNPGQKMSIIRIDESEYEWSEEKITGIRLQGRTRRQ